VLLKKVEILTANQVGVLRAKIGKNPALKTFHPAHGGNKHINAANNSPTPALSQPLISLKIQDFYANIEIGSAVI
jgi:hypothetical protein